MQIMIVINQEVKFNPLTKHLQLFQPYTHFISMTPFNIIPSLLNLRSLVQNHSDINQILKSIDSITNQVNHFWQIQAKVSQLRSQAKKMKTKAKKLQKEMCLCSKQRDCLADQLQKTRQVHNSKLQKIANLISYNNQAGLSSKKPYKSTRPSKTTFGVQCQIITQSRLLELNENQKKILIKLQILQQQYDDLYEQNKAKDIYIQQILQALQTSPLPDVQNDDLKSNDDSTLDDNSVKAQETQIEEYQHQQSCQRNHNGWIQSLFEKSIKLYSFIFH